MSDCCDLKYEREFSKIKDSHFQHLGVIKIVKSSSNLALYFQMRFPILVHCDQRVLKYFENEGANFPKRDKSNPLPLNFEGVYVFF